jgi:DNA recombination protein RmuC
MPTEQILLIAVAALAGVTLLLLGVLIGGRGKRKQIASDASVSLPAGAEALAPAFAELRGQLGEAQRALAEVRQQFAAEEGRRPLEEQRAQGSYELLQRLSATLLGSARAGAAGERIVGEALAALPPQWLITDHKVGSKVVEYAIKLPDGLILPIDSKVVAQSDLDELDRIDDPRKREAKEKQIRSDVFRRVAEVRQYVDGRTPGFAVAAVSDAAYRLCGGILPAAYKDYQALVVPYSLLAPFVLMIYEQHRRSGVDLDAAQQARSLADAETHLKRATDELNGRMSGALTQFRNGYEELNQELARAGRALESMRGAVEAGGNTGAKVGATNGNGNGAHANGKNGRN